MGNDMKAGDLVATLLNWVEFIIIISYWFLIWIFIIKPMNIISPLPNRKYEYLEKMRICYIASPSIHTTKWLKYFVDTGHEVHMITSSSPSDDMPSGVEIHYLKRIPIRNQLINIVVNALPLFCQFKFQIRKIRPDVLHAHQVTDTALLGALSGFHPFVVTPWGSDVLIIPHKSWVAHKIAETVLKKADLITCDAEHIIAHLVKLGADYNKIKLINFGVDTNKFKPLESRMLKA